MYFTYIIYLAHNFCINHIIYINHILKYKKLVKYFHNLFINIYKKIFIFFSIYKNGK